MSSAAAEGSPPTKGVSRRRIRFGAQDGQSLIIVTLAMFVIIVFAAFAVDLATWYQKHHQAQVAADAAALAAANCLLRSSSTSTSTTICATATDTARASNVATTIANTNAVPISGSVSYGTTAAGVVTNVTVTSATTVKALFSNAVGITSAGVSARAVASLNWSFTDCTTIGNQPGGGCLMFYAAANTCGSGSSASIQMQVGQSDVLNGGIFSNGSIDDSQGNGGTINGPVTYGSGSSCASNTTFKGNADAQGAFQQTTDRGTTSSPNWPIDYSTLFPACSGGTCGPAGTPSYCTYSQPSFSTYHGSGVYCAFGTGTPSTPSTWNGTITFPSGTGTAASPDSVTLIGGNISLSSNSVYTANSHNLFAYATCGNTGTSCTSTQAPYFSAVGGGLTYTGDVFVPYGQASYTGGNVDFTGMTEAQTILDDGGDQTGDGPAFQGGTQLIPGSSYLSQ